MPLSMNDIWKISLLAIAFILTCIWIIGIVRKKENLILLCPLIIAISLVFLTQSSLADRGEPAPWDAFWFDGINLALALIASITLFLTFWQLHSEFKTQKLSELSSKTNLNEKEKEKEKLTLLYTYKDITKPRKETQEELMKRILDADVEYRKQDGSIIFRRVS